MKSPRPRSRVTRAATGLAALIALELAGVAGVAGVSLPPAGASLPPTGAATTSAASPTPLLPSQLPAGSPPGEVALHVLPESDGGDLLVVGVRIDGHGPYPFVLDTGAADTVISPALSTEFGLPAGPPLGHEAEGAACGTQPSAGTTPRFMITSWQVGSVRLPATAAIVLPGLGSGSTTIDGLLGSDALSGLSALTIDYGTARATLGPAPAHPAGRQVALDVARSMGEVFPIAPVTIGSARYTFVVDSGASESAITPSASAALHLGAGGKGVSVSGSTCSATVGQVGVGNWHLGAVSLPRESLLSVSLPYAGLPKPVGQVSGLIGGNVLASFGTVTIDYARQRLTLG